MKIGESMNVEKQVRKFDKQARVYDERRMKLEFGQFRNRLLHSANGRVLELGVGAGGNLPFYRSDIQLTAVDFSPAMIEKARIANEQKYRLQAEFIVSDVDTLSLPEQSFDTIVSTLSLCAYQHPEKVLLKLNKWSKPNGQILLMEHGKSESYKIVAFVQNVINPLYYRFIGCHQNRDIMGLIKSSPLQVEKVEHYKLGMMQLIWCRPSTLA